VPQGTQFQAQWSAPQCFALKLGVSALDRRPGNRLRAVDLNDAAPNSVDVKKVKWEGTPSVAAGQSGAIAAAATDIVMKAEILSYSRAQGLFAGCHWRVRRWLR